MYAKYIKRPMDFTLSLLAIIVLSPIMGITALLVKIKLGSPVLFKQPRPGKDEKIFILYKFRTMNEKKDDFGNLLPDKIRLTKFGKFLRNSSLDELPEIFNILKGDMSIVGPRPLLVKYLPLYNEHQKKRHSVRPGLTGYAQVNGRNTLDWDERLDMDVYYTENITFLSDIKLILNTVISVIKKDGIDSTQTEKYTMVEFSGSGK